MMGRVVCRVTSSRPQGVSLSDSAGLGMRREFVSEEGGTKVIQMKRGTAAMPGAFRECITVITRETSGSTDKTVTHRIDA